MNGRKPTQTMSSEPEKWTWQMAEAALAHNRNNRHVRDNRFEQYGRLMKNKQWGVEEAKQGYRACIAPIVFDWDGTLSDGQHRLLGQVWSKTTQWWYVIRNAPPTIQGTIDLQVPRRPADLLAWYGYENTTSLQGVARWAWLLEHDLAASGRIHVANEEIRQMVIDHPDLQHSVEMAMAIRTGTRFFDKLIGTTPLGAAHWWIAQFNDHREADIFIDRMVHMNREPDGSAILALWNRLTMAAGVGTYGGTHRETIQLRVKLAMVIRTWNTDVSGKYVKKIASKSRTGVYLVPKPRKRRVSQEEFFGPQTKQSSTEADEESPDDEFVSEVVPDDQ